MGKSHHSYVPLMPALWHLQEDRQFCSLRLSPGLAVQDSAKPVRPGETIYKGHHSYDLMRNLQLGIIFSIAKSVEQAAAGALKEPVKDEAFTQQVGCPLSPTCLFPWLLVKRLISLQGWHSNRDTQVLSLMAGALSCIGAIMSHCRSIEEV